MHTSRNCASSCVRRFQVSIGLVVLLGLYPACAAEKPPSAGDVCGNEPTLTMFPIRGPHDTGFQQSPDPGDSSAWTCDGAHSNSDFFEDSDCGDAHYGVDIWAAEGAPVVATVRGTVVAVEESAYSGNQVKIRDECGFHHYFIHLQGFASGLQVEQSIEAGTLIGYVGKTGSASNGVVHLHYSIFKDEYCNGVDPGPALLAVESNVCDG